MPSVMALSRRHYDNTFKDNTYDDLTYNINKCNFTYICFYLLLQVKSLICKIDYN